ncbi:MAG: IS1 family transposase, partial [Gammaproteobacteria bacterium]|nr:IS1 family transposase [Gammaproteobacteria bacterium]
MALHFDYALRLRSNSVKTPGLYGYAGVVVHRSASLASMYSFIEQTVKPTCRSCQSENIVKNGRNAGGKQQYRCKDCGVHRVLEPTVRYDQGRKEEILRAYQERSSLR